MERSGIWISSSHFQRNSISDPFTEQLSGSFEPKPRWRLETLAVGGLLAAICVIRLQRIASVFAFVSPKAFPYSNSKFPLDNFIGFPGV